MSEAKYAGPWSWDGSYPIRVIDSDGYIVCDGIMPSRDRDTILIASAPEMYQALDLLMAWLEGDRSVAEEAVSKARAALAKADGRQA